MAALTPVQHVAVHLFVVWIQFAQAPEDSEVRAKPRDNVTLQCNAPTHAAIKLLKWSTPGLDDNVKRYVFYFSDNRANESYQNPRYRGRVELKDPLMENGNASVLLKNVSIKDTGTYQCEVITNSNNRRKRDVREFVSSVHLIVSDEVKAKPGEDVTLQCNSSTDAAIKLLEWNRTEMERYVFYSIDNMLYKNYQNPRYQDRVELKDPEMKNGDASILLKNVTINDTGTYECRVTTNSNNSNLGVLVSSVHLIVSDGPTKEQLEEQVHRGHVGLGVSLGLVCLVVVGLVVKSKRAKEKRSAECIDEQEMSKLNT